MKKIYTLQELKNSLGVWILGVIISLLFTAFFTVLIIWINIEQSEILHVNGQLQAELDKRIEHLAKLEVEHGRLISPYELETKAKSISMGIAEPGQIRRLYPEDDTAFLKSINDNEPRPIPMKYVPEIKATPRKKVETKVETNTEVNTVINEEIEITETNTAEISTEVSNTETEALPEDEQ